jgi:putative flavoprotein involved in K+ transport
MTTVPVGEDDLTMKEPQQDLTEGGGTLERFSIVVIGGGQTGLAAGYELVKRGIDFVILERGSRLGEHWRPRWDSLRVFTPARFDGLPGLPFHGDEGRNLTKDQMSGYLEKYAERFALPVQLGVNVLGLSADEGGQIVVECEHRRIVADKVIVATAFQKARPRTTLGLEPRMIRLRPGEYRTLGQLSQGGELVVLQASSTGLAHGASQGSDDAR